jgi:hypothetical protein
MKPKLFNLKLTKKQRVNQVLNKAITSPPPSPSPIKGEGKFGFSLYSIGRKIILITTI